MIKWIKNIIITLGFLFSSSTLKVGAQNYITVFPSQYNSWVLSNTSCYGCGSFYVIVTNSGYIDGYYYYDIYLWSNSFYTNGYTANSYIKNMNVYSIDSKNNRINIFNLDYVLVPPKSDFFDGYYYLGYAYSTNANQAIKLTWATVEAW